MFGYLAHVSHVLNWLLLAFVDLTAIIGLLFITRGTAVRRVRSIGTDGKPVAPAEPEFILTIALLTGTPLLGGNRVDIMLNGNEIFPRLWEDLRSATRSITVQMYYAHPGKVADTLTEILAERAKAGVNVLVLYDAFGARPARDSFERLRKNRVRAVPFRPFKFENLWIMQNRSHVRGIVIDGKIGWTGGFGIDDKWLGGGLVETEWRDTSVRFEGPAVRQLQAAFVAGWSEATRELITGRIAADRCDDGVALAGLLYTAPNLGSTPAERYLALSIAGAKEKLFVTNAYFAPDENFVGLLRDAARRGVDVRILVGGPKTDVRAARLAAHSRYEKLLSVGIRIFEYQPSTLHAKTFVVDAQWVSVGTMNFDNRSLALNDESTLMVLDVEIGKQMEKIFFDDLSHSEEIDLKTFRKRPFYEHIAEHGASQLTRLL
ncbi:MAG: phosphatidylserine/phosphatidylglycerophosphate/cardiolipin synthase family protein [Gemmatimonadaceae bacterium]